MIPRAAGDSGAVDVFKAVFYLPPPRALNWMVKDAFGGPTLVLQVRMARKTCLTVPTRVEVLVLQVAPTGSPGLVRVRQSWADGSVSRHMIVCRPAATP